MGIYSTRTVSRQEAIEIIMSHVEHIDEMTNDEISNLLFEIVGKSHFSNFWVLNEKGEEPFDDISDLHYDVTNCAYYGGDYGF